jgi:hypothetical protein
MVTPGISGYWNYNLGKALTNEITFVYPIPGTSTFTYKGTLGAEFFEKTIDVTIDQLDNPLDQDWYDLVSENTSAGKTWVLNGGPSPDGGFWWFMSPPDNKDGAWTVWWNAGGDCCPPSDAAGKMKFDLNGAANYTYNNGNGAEVQRSFVLDVTNQVLQVNDAPLLGGVDGRGSSTGIYQIVSLTEDEMVLYTPRSPDGAGFTGWTYIFKPE